MKALIQGDWKIVSHQGTVLEEDADWNAQFLLSDSCSSVADFALFNLAEDPYEQHPYLYDTGDTTSDRANKLEKLVGRLRELAADRYQTGMTEAYAHPGEAISGPLATACSVAQVQAALARTTTAQRRGQYDKGWGPGA